MNGDIPGFLPSICFFVATSAAGTLIYLSVNLEIYFSQIRRDWINHYTHQKISDNARWRPKEPVLLNDERRGYMHVLGTLPVHLLIPLSSTLKMKTAPLLIMDRRSVSLSRRVMRGITPCRAAWIKRKAFTVVST